MDTLDAWISRVTADSSHRQIAERTGVGHGVFSRWVREDKFPLAQLLDFCRVYDANFLEAITVAGYASEDEVHRWTPHASLRGATELELVQELARRITTREALGDGVRDLVREEVAAEVRGVLSMTGPIDLHRLPRRTA